MHNTGHRDLAEGWLQEWPRVTEGSHLLSPLSRLLPALVACPCPSVPTLPEGSCFTFKSDQNFSPLSVPRIHTRVGLLLLSRPQNTNDFIIPLSQSPQASPSMVSLSAHPSAKDHQGSPVQNTESQGPATGPLPFSFVPQEHQIWASRNKAERVVFMWPWGEIKSTAGKSGGHGGAEEKGCVPRGR